MATKLTDVQKDRLNELVKENIDASRIKQVLSEEFGLNLSIQMIGRYKNKDKIREYSINDQEWYRRGEKLNRIESNMIDVVDVGYQKLRDYVDNVIIDNPKDADAVVKAIKQAQTIHEKIIKPARTDIVRKKIEKEIES